MYDIYDGDKVKMIKCDMCINDSVMLQWMWNAMHNVKSLEYMKVTSAEVK